MSEQKVIFGMDPEFTFWDAEGRPVPAHRLGYPDKQNKVKSWERNKDDQYGQFSTMHRDGTNLEINTVPFNCRGQQILYLRAALQAAEISAPKGVTLRGKAAYDIDLNDLMSDAPEDVQHFGCEPAFDSYTGEANAVDIDAATHPRRYAGFHLHFGSYKTGANVVDVLTHPQKYMRLGQLMDWLMGIPCAVVYNGDEQFQRREHYGKAGEFRPQRYGETAMGFEYRTLPPEIGNHHAMIGLFFGVGRFICENFDKLDESYNPAWGKEIAEAINTGKNPEKFLTTVPGFYTPDTILKLRGVPNIYKWSLPYYKGNTEIGWSEFAHEWGLKINENSLLSRILQIAA